MQEQSYTYDVDSSAISAFWKSLVDLDIYLSAAWEKHRSMNQYARVLHMHGIEYIWTAR